MCGIAGFAGVPRDKRLILTRELAKGIDRRGGHAAGFLSLFDTKAKNSIFRGRTDGTWKDATDEFVRNAARGLASILHARMATCGVGGVEEAHPFRVERNGSPVLLGVHNGVLTNTHQSASKHGREHTVDSLELLELLADGLIDEIGEITGYGTIAWVDMKHKNVVKMVRLTYGGDLVIGRLKTGAIYGSTKMIVEDALKAADMSAESLFTPEPFHIYTISLSGDIVDTKNEIKLKSAYSGKVTYGSSYYSDKEDKDWSNNYGSYGHSSYLHSSSTKETPKLPPKSSDNSDSRGDYYDWALKRNKQRRDTREALRRWSIAHRKDGSHFGSEDESEPDIEEEHWGKCRVVKEDGTRPSYTYECSLCGKKHESFWGEPLPDSVGTVRTPSGHWVFVCKDTCEDVGVEAKEDVRIAI